ncbi:hypothetical protein D3C75_335690 [compost metagenome]
MHFLRIGAVEVYNIRRDPFAEVCFEAVYTHIYQTTQVPCIPFTSRRVRKVYESHARLPKIGLIYVTIWFFKQIAVLLAFFKQR